MSQAGTKCIFCSFSKMFSHSSIRIHLGSLTALRYKGLVWETVTTAFVSVWPSPVSIACIHRSFFVNFGISTSCKPWAWLIRFYAYLEVFKAFLSIDSHLKQLSCSSCTWLPWIPVNTFLSWGICTNHTSRDVSINS